MTVPVRGPGETGGAIGFALIFWLFFHQGKKNRKIIQLNHSLLSFACAKESKIILLKTKRTESY